MADVWAARRAGDPGFDGLVAVKVIAPSRQEDESFERMLRREAATVADLCHPNVCQTLDFQEDDGTLFMVMEWVDGGSLGSLCHDEVIAPALAARILAAACMGLHAAHELRDASGTPLELVHRDVSPDNILVTRDGGVKVADFGVAKAMGARAATGSLSTNFKGKFAYSAPERLARQRVTRQADLFSVGCVLYQVTLGLQPFDAENDLAVVRRIAEADVTPPREIDPTYPPALEMIVLRCLSPRPTDRHATAWDLANDLLMFADGGEASRGTAEIAALVDERLGSEIDERLRAILGGEAATGAASVASVASVDWEDLPTVAMFPRELLPRPGVRPPKAPDSSAVARVLPLARALPAPEPRRAPPAPRVPEVQATAARTDDPPARALGSSRRSVAIVGACVATLALAGALHLVSGSPVESARTALAPHAFRTPPNVTDPASLPASGASAAAATAEPATPRPAWEQRGASGRPGKASAGRPPAGSAPPNTTAAEGDGGAAAPLPNPY